MKKSIILLTVLGLMTISSCKNWLDINYDPNNSSATNVTVDLLLTSMQYDQVYVLQTYSTNYFSIPQFLTKSGEYSGTYVFLTGMIMPQSGNDWWSYYYSRTNNLVLMIDKAKEMGNKNAYVGIGLTMFAFNVQRLVDLFGDVPYSDAFKGTEERYPEYDKAQDIYADLLVKIDEAIAALDAAISTGEDIAALKKSDIMCDGNLQKWKRAAYSMKLRLLMRTSYVQDVSSQVAAIADKCLAIDENVTMNPGYYLASSKMNLIYQVFGYNQLGNMATSNREYRPTTLLVDMLKNHNDPRLRAYIEPRTAAGSPTDNTADYKKFGLENDLYVGIPYGQMQPPRLQYTAGIGRGVLGDSFDKFECALADNYVWVGSDVGFFLAEAALRGLIPGGDAKAKEYYEAAVTSVMKRYTNTLTTDYNPGPPTGAEEDYTYYYQPAITGTVAEAAAEYLSQNDPFVNWDLMTTEEQKIEAIASQKWLGLYMIDGMEAWFEFRRLDYPRLRRSVSNVSGDKILSRLEYPQTEWNYNGDVVAKQAPVDIWNTLLFWDRKNEVVPFTDIYQ